jgi:CHRD domain
MRVLRRFAFIGPAAIGVAALVLVVGLPSVALGDDRRDFTAHFLGVNETPSISTDATADLRVRINGSGDDDSITYTLTFSGLRAPVTQAHIHFGQTKVAGGIMVFLCGTSTSPGPAGTPTCPQSGTVSRTLTAADVVGPAGQGIAPGEMARVIRAIRDGAAYGNVHSTMFPSGETRGQLTADDRR